MSIQEHDLIDFFGSEHISREFGSEWFDSDSLYQHQQANGLTITLAIHPIHNDARITLSLADENCYDWQVTALADIQYDRLRKSLRFVTAAGDALAISIVPRISLSHEYPFRRE